MSPSVNPIAAHEHLGELRRRLYSGQVLKRPWEEVAHRLFAPCHRGVFHCGISEVDKCTNDACADSHRWCHTFGRNGENYVPEESRRQYSRQCVTTEGYHDLKKFNQLPCIMYLTQVSSLCPPLVTLVFGKHKCWSGSNTTNGPDK